jgi:hypothetical protein
VPVTSIILFPQARESARGDDSSVVLDGVCSTRTDQPEIQNSGFHSTAATC